jgi:DNA-binding NtrC family response regulator
MIQLIEDDLVTCHIITALLKRMRLPYCEAHTGAEAMEQLKTLPIDLVIADMMLPDANGLELLEQKHSQPHLADIPVVCCTAQADIETVEAAMGLGAIDFIKKPIVIPIFTQRINRAMERVHVRWESLREMSKRMPFYSRTIHPMLVIAQQVLRDLDDALAEAERGTPNANELNTLVSRMRGAAANVGALRTVQQLDKLWSGSAATNEITNLRAALIIELAGFDAAISQYTGAGAEPQAVAV